jgi:hypothetical protein
MRIDQTYQTLLEENEVSDPALIRELLKFAREDLAKFDSPKFAKYGMLRRWREAVRLRIETGKIDHREQSNFVGISPIYGYNSNGEEVLVADGRVFHQLYSTRFASMQQKTAFRILLVAFLLQLIAVLVP